MWFNAFFFQITKNNGIATNDAVMKGQASFDSDPYVQAIQHFVDLDRGGHHDQGLAGHRHVNCRWHLPARRSGDVLHGHLVRFWPQDGEVCRLRRDSLSDHRQLGKVAGACSIIRSYGVAATSSHKDEAIEVVKAMAGVDFQKASTSIPGSGLPLLKSLQGLNPDPIAQSFSKIAPSTVIWLDALWEPEIIAAVQTGVQTAIVGSATPKEVAASIAQKYEQLRQDGKTYYK